MDRCRVIAGVTSVSPDMPTRLRNGVRVKPHSILRNDAGSDKHRVESEEEKGRIIPHSRRNSREEEREGFSSQGVIASPWFPDGQPHPLILASASPRRREILRQVGLRFVQVHAEADETWPVGVPPEEAVQAIALRKALAVVPEYPDGIIIGADTSVILDDKPLGKPGSPEEAVRMLCRLAGRMHRVVTGIALVDGRSRMQTTDAVSTEVWMRPATRQELAAYVASGEPSDKAGAYGIQGLGAGLVTEIRGCYFNVVGLPITRTIECLQKLVEARRASR